MYYCYILECSDGSYYVGSTQDVEARVNRHNLGGSKYTKTKRPVTLVYSEKYQTRSLAIVRERQIKSWKSREEIKKLINHKAPSSSS